MLRRSLLLTLSCVLLTSCGMATASPGTPLYVRRAASMALINVGVTALVDGWYADHGTYAGATAARLRKYDQSVDPRLVVKSYGGTRYCVEMNRGSGADIHMVGPPRSTFVNGHCP